MLLWSGGQSKEADLLNLSNLLAAGGLLLCHDALEHLLHLFHALLLIITAHHTCPLVTQKQINGGDPGGFCIQQGCNTQAPDDVHHFPNKSSGSFASMLPLQPSGYCWCCWNTLRDCLERKLSFTVLPLLFIRFIAAICCCPCTCLHGFNFYPSCCEKTILRQ